MTRAWRITLFGLPIAAIAFIFRDYFGQRFPAHFDTLTQFYPYFVYLTHGGYAVAQEIFSGFPLSVSTNSVLSPLTAPMVFLFGTFNAYKFLILVHMVLAYVFGYLYARKIQFSHLTALCVATTFTFSGQLMLWADTVPNASYYFLLPAVLYFTELSAEATRLRQLLYLLLTGALLGVGWLSGHSQYILYIHALFALYVLYVFGIRNRKSLPFLLSLAVSAAVGATRILATLDFQPLTERSDGVNYTNLFIHAYWPHDLIHYLLPFFTIPVASPNSFNLYIGILPLVLLVLSFFLFRKVNNKRFFFYAAVFVFCLVSSFKYSPLAYLIHALPLFDSVRGVSRIMFLGDFAAALLAGFGLQYLLDKKEDATRLLNSFTKVLTYVTGGAVALITALTGFYILFANDAARFFYNFFSRLIEPPLTADQSARFLADISQTVHTILHQLTLLDYQTDVFLIVLMFTLILLRCYGRLTSERFAALALILITLNLAAVYATYFKTVDATSITAVPPTIQFIKDREATSTYPFRVYDLPYRITATSSCVLSSEDNHVVDNATAEPDVNLLYGLDTPAGYDGFVPVAVKNDVASLSGLNVKYVFSSIPVHDSDLTPIFSAPIGRCKTPIYLYELRGYWPRYYLGDTQHPVTAALSGNTIVFDVDAGVVSQNLLIGNAYLPRWQATVDGNPAPIQRANTIYMSVSVPPGKHHVVLTYKPLF
jgi:hypothetical protein